jgi:hypothetical protein
LGMVESRPGNARTQLVVFGVLLFHFYLFFNYKLRIFRHRKGTVALCACQYVIIRNSST